jgi:hypothetical protein
VAASAGLKTAAQARSAIALKINTQVQAVAQSYLRWATGAAILSATASTKTISTARSMVIAIGTFIASGSVKSTSQSRATVSLVGIFTAVRSQSVAQVKSAQSLKVAAQAVVAKSVSQTRATISLAGDFTARMQSVAQNRGAQTLRIAALGLSKSASQVRALVSFIIALSARTQSGTQIKVGQTLRIASQSIARAMTQARMPLGSAQIFAIANVKTISTVRGLWVAAGTFAASGLVKTISQARATVSLVSTLPAARMQSVVQTSSAQALKIAAQVLASTAAQTRALGSVQIFAVVSVKTISTARGLWVGVSTFAASGFSESISQARAVTSLASTLTARTQSAVQVKSAQALQIAAQAFASTATQAKALNSIQILAAASVKTISSIRGILFAHGSFTALGILKSVSQARGTASFVSTFSASSVAKSISQSRAVVSLSGIFTARLQSARHTRSGQSLKTAAQAIISSIGRIVGNIVSFIRSPIRGVITDVSVIQAKISDFSLSGPIVIRDVSIIEAKVGDE